MTERRGKSTDDTQAFNRSLIRQLLNRDGRRADDRIVAILRALKEVVLIVAIIAVTASGGDPSSLIGG